MKALRKSVSSLVQKNPEPKNSGSVRLDLRKALESTREVERLAERNGPTPVVIEKFHGAATTLIALARRVEETSGQGHGTSSTDAHQALSEIKTLANAHQVLSEMQTLLDTGDSLRMSTVEQITVHAKTMKMELSTFARQGGEPDLQRATAMRARAQSDSLRDLDSIKTLLGCHTEALELAAEGLRAFVRDRQQADATAANQREEAASAQAMRTVRSAITEQTHSDGRATFEPGE